MTATEVTEQQSVHNNGDCWKKLFEMNDCSRARGKEEEFQTEAWDRWVEVVAFLVEPMAWCFNVSSFQSESGRSLLIELLPEVGVAFAKHGRCGGLPVNVYRMWVGVLIGDSMAFYRAVVTSSLGTFMLDITWPLLIHLEG